MCYKHFSQSPHFLSNFVDDSISSMHILILAISFFPKNYVFYLGTSQFSIVPKSILFGNKRNKEKFSVCKRILDRVRQKIEGILRKVFITYYHIRDTLKTTNRVYNLLISCWKQES